MYVFKAKKWMFDKFFNQLMLPGYAEHHFLVILEIMRSATNPPATTRLIQQNLLLRAAQCSAKEKTFHDFWNWWHDILHSIYDKNFVLIDVFIRGCLKNPSWWWNPKPSSRIFFFISLIKATNFKNYMRFTSFCPVDSFQPKMKKKTYLSGTFGPNLSDFLAFCLHWSFIVIAHCALWYWVDAVVHSPFNYPSAWNVCDKCLVNGDWTDFNWTAKWASA